MVASAEAKKLVDERYETFDAKRKAHDRAVAAKMEDITELRRIADTSTMGEPTR